MENATGFREAKMQAHSVSVVEYGMDNKKGSRVHRTFGTISLNVANIPMKKTQKDFLYIRVPQHCVLQTAHLCLCVGVIYEALENPRCNGQKLQHVCI